MEDRAVGEGSNVVALEVLSVLGDAVPVCTFYTSRLISPATYTPMYWESYRPERIRQLHRNDTPRRELKCVAICLVSWWYYSRPV